MPLRPSRRLAALFGAASAVTLFVGCASLGVSEDGKGPPGKLMDAGSSVIVTDAAFVDAGARSDGGVFNPHCGAVRFCGLGIPDDVAACADYDAGAPPTSGDG